MTKAQQPPPYSLRIDPELKKVLEDAARENGRSLHAEIVSRLVASTDFKPGSEIELEERIRRIATEVFQELDKRQK